MNSGKLIKFLSFVRATGMNERGGMKNGGGPTSLATGVKLTLLLTRGEARSLFLFDLLLLFHERNTRLVANLSKKFWFYLNLVWLFSVFFSVNPLKEFWLYLNSFGSFFLCQSFERILVLFKFSLEASFSVNPSKEFWFYLKLIWKLLSLSILRNFAFI